jgi:transcriptional regulator with PAS, ATPase and Fis domain
VGDERDTRDLITNERGKDRPVPGVLAVFSDGKPLLAAIPLDDGKVQLGRDEARGITDDRVSREHAVVALDRGTWTVTDQNSRNGTFVNGRRITGTATIDPPRVVRLAYTSYLVVDDLRPYEDARVATTEDRIVAPAFAAALEQLRRAADHDVLITGETGVGKELAARELHIAGGGGPFVAMNCAAIPETVAERLLFGSVRGAYSGAVDATGYLEAADGGMLFLDEVGDLDLAVQAKLLRVLETREVVPLGATRGRTVTTRCCFAGSRSLRAAMAEGTFRPDLYYRIARSEVQVPPLRERREEIPWLVAHELGARTPHARLVEECLLRPWPGNVRELRNAIHSAAERAGDEQVVRAEHLDPAVGQAPAGGGAALRKPQEITREHLQAAIAEHDGNMSAVARALGLHRSQLYRLLEQHNLSR